MARTSNREPTSDDEVWSTVTDPHERRKIQNRNNQRAFRKRRAADREASDAKPGRATRRTQPLLLPKPPSGANTEISTELRSSEQESLIRWQSSRSPSPRFATFHDTTGATLDLHAQRVFQYASQCLQTCFGWDIDSRQDSVATALMRLSLQDPLVLHSFLWTAANELNVQSAHVENALVLHRSQNSAIELIRQSIEHNNISDGLIFAIYALTSNELSAPSATEADEMYSPSVTAESSTARSPLAPPGWEVDPGQRPEANMHAQVAVRLLRSRGGLRSITTPGLAEQMQAVDLLRSSQSRAKPLFGLCRAYQRVLQTEMADYRRKERLKCWVPSSCRDLFTDLRCYARQIELFDRHGSPPAVRPQQLVVWRNINQHRLLSWPDEDERVWKLTCLLVSSLLFLPVSDAQTSEEMVEQLTTLLIDEADEAREMHVWSICVGVVTTAVDEQREKLEELAIEVHVQFGLEGWEDVKSILERYLWVDDVFDEQMEDFWAKICSYESA